MFYTYDEDLTIKWCENLFLAFLYQKSKENKSTANIATSTTEAALPHNIEGFDDTVSKLDFDIEEDPISSGNLGKVLRAKRRENGEQVVLKSKSKLSLRKHDMLEYAISENAILRKIESPFVVRVYETFETKNSLYFVLEHCQGKTLESVLKESTYLSQEIAVMYIG